MELDLTEIKLKNCEHFAQIEIKNKKYKEKSKYSRIFMKIHVNPRPFKC